MLLHCVAVAVFAVGSNAGGSPLPQRDSCNTIAALKVHYQNYIDALNGNITPGSLEPYIAEGVVALGSTFSVAEVETNVRDAQAELPGLHFDVVQIVVEKVPGPLGSQGFAHVAVLANVTFVSDLTASSVTVLEFVFYQFEAGKIAAASSLVDTRGLSEKQAESAHNRL